MSRRSDPLSSPLLPFDDGAGFPGNTPPGIRPPTAFISYTHETPEHNDRALDLANKLRAQGVNCEIDKYQISPPEGWPLWMQKQIQKADFVIVICTQTYLRRCTGEEIAGKGKGAAWEGRSIYQILYDAVENRRVIPVVFAPEDVANIPLILKSATYYDLSNEDGYRALHRALTNQPRITRPPLGSMVRRLPDLERCESQVAALLRLCPDPLPFDVVARGVEQTVAELTTELQRVARTSIVKISSETIELQDRSADGIPVPPSNVVGSALGAALDFVGNHRDATGRAQMMNIIELARAADTRTASIQVSRTFRSVQSWLKSSGDKRLVLEVARLSIEASRVSGRGREQVKDEAVAAICGVSWVYQRTGRLSEARVEAERSRKLGLDIHWNRNTAFCNKCLGRLARMESEAVQKSHRRTELLNESVRLLRKAIDGFTKLELDAEVGDCYSLLARTHLAAGDRQSARDAMKQADERLVDSANKDYLDLQIVKGDLMRYRDRGSAEALYTDVLSTNGHNDAQKSEIVARAYLHRGRVRIASRDSDGALTDFKQAAKIWDDLEDPTADFAYWEIEQNAPWMDKETKLLLMREPVGVGVRAARIVGTETAGRPVGRSHRQRLPRRYLDGVISRATEQLVRDRPAW